MVEFARGKEFCVANATLDAQHHARESESFCLPITLELRRIEQDARTKSQRSDSW
jgi:hypothetical protein